MAENVAPPWFVQQMQRMGELRFPPTSMQMHWDGLQGMRLEHLEAAVTRAIQTRTYFPTPAELREDADVATPTGVWQRPTGGRACEACEDTGWRDVDTSRGRAVTRCACWEQNPVIQQQRAASRKYAETRQADRRRA